MWRPMHALGGVMVATMLPAVMLAGGNERGGGANSASRHVADRHARVPASL